MNHQPSSRTARGFSRADLLVLLGVLGLLACIVLPALAGTRRGSEFAACFNNLRQVGRAFHVWGDDHDGLLPWGLVAWEGGTRSHTLVGNAWLHFSWVSNELATPRVLACPSDTQKRVAWHFGTASGGFLNAVHRNNALSYFIGTDAPSSLPAAMVSGDRNLPVNGFGSCSVGANNVAYIANRPLPITTVWTNGIHHPFGNTLHVDGRVEQTTDTTLRQLLPLADDVGSVHLLIP